MGTGELRRASERLAKAASQVLAAHREKLLEIKQQADEYGRQPEFIWEALLQSMATLGSSTGYRLLNEEYHSRVTFGKLAGHRPKERKSALEKTLRDAGVRFPKNKAEWLDENFDRINREGGPTEVDKKLKSLQGRDAKLAFLKTFRGIGEKYSRNIMMDAHHPEFLDCIAVDARIKGISKGLGVSFQTYEDEERFYLDVARQVGIEGWDLDRMLWEWDAEFRQRLGVPGRRTGRAMRCRGGRRGASEA